MTLASTASKEIKLGNDVTVVFNFTFIVNQAPDLVVTLTDVAGVETVLVEGTGVANYSVSVGVYPGNGSITYPATLGTELATGETLTLSRTVDLDQETNLINLGAWKPEQVESTFDYSRMIDLQQQEQLDRSIRVPISDNSGANFELPAPTADTVIGVWNATGTAIVAGPNASDIVNAQAEAVAAAASAAAAAASETAAGASEVAAAASETAAGISETAALASAIVADDARDAIAISYQYSTNITMADPGVGLLRLNNATIGSATSMAIDAITADTGNPDMSDWIATWDDSTNIIKGQIILRQIGDPATFAIFDVTAVTDNTGWLQITIAHVASNGTFTNLDTFSISYVRAGDAGTGALDNIVEDLTPQLGAALDTNSFAINYSEGAAVASAASPDIWAGDGNTIHITGSTTITGFAAAPRAGATRRLIMDAAPLFTDGANLIVAGNTDFQSAAGDVAFVYAETTTQFRVFFEKADGTPVVAGGGELGTLLASATASASASLDFTSFIDATYEVYALVFSRMVPATNNAALWLRISDDGGATFETTLYRWAINGHSGGGGITTSSLGDSKIQLTSSAALRGIGNAATEAGVSGTLYIYDPATAGRAHLVAGNLTYESDDSTATTVSVSGLVKVNTLAIDGLRLMMSSGNIASGKVYLYGIVKA